MVLKPSSSSHNAGACPEQLISRQPNKGGQHREQGCCPALQSTPEARLKASNRPVRSEGARVQPESCRKMKDQQQQDQFQAEAPCPKATSKQIGVQQGITEPELGTETPESKAPGSSDNEDEAPGAPRTSI